MTTPTSTSTPTPKLKLKSIAKQIDTIAASKIDLSTLKGFDTCYYSPINFSIKCNGLMPRASQVLRVAAIIADRYSIIINEKYSNSEHKIISKSYELKFSILVKLALTTFDFLIYNGRIDFSYYEHYKFDLIAAEFFGFNINLFSLDEKIIALLLLSDSLNYSLIQALIKESLS